MGDIKVAGRICDLLTKAGESVAEGDDIALVEAMKMEIPVAATASGIIKISGGRVDDMIAEDKRLRPSKPSRE